MIIDKIIPLFSISQQSKQIRINLNIINKINSVLMTNRSNHKQFSIIKFQPSNILLLHKFTKTVYQYYEIQPDINPQFDITHPALIRPVAYNNGVLYPKGLSTLQVELQNRKKAFNIVHYQQEEIYNTFVPLLEFIGFLHEKGIVHGSICPSNIVITQQEKIKIRDWLVDSKQQAYYCNKNKKEITKDDDLIALGQIMAEAAILRKGSTILQQKQSLQLLQSIVDKYSKGFVIALSVLLKKRKQKFPHIIHYLNNQEKYLNDIQLTNFYETIKKQKDKKKMTKIINQNNILNPNSLKLTVASLHQSPLKKNTPNNSLGNTIKRLKEDNQNKKTGNDQTKKKQIQKINKIIERSNQFVNELMARKNNQHILKKIAPKTNIANISTYADANKKTVKDSTVVSSPSKKMRTSSRKK